MIQSLSCDKFRAFEWLDNPVVSYVWLRLLLKANEEDRQWNGIDLKRGQLVTGLRMLSDELNLTPKQVRTAIEKLQKGGYLGKQSGNRFSVVTICDYDSWMSEGQTKGKPMGKQTANKGQAEEPQDNDFYADFEECWIAYNRKGSKKKSLEYWKKLSEQERQSVLPHIRVYVTSRERQYQKDFERYLRDKVFNEVVVKGNTTIYDPQHTTDNEYHPFSDGIFLIWNEAEKKLIFNGDIDHLNDGYTDDTRPDGATVSQNMYNWKWSRTRKQWIKQW